VSYSDQQAAAEHVVGFEVYGIRGRVTVPSPDLLAPVVKQLPLHAVRCDPQPADRHFAIDIADDGDYVVTDDTTEIARRSKLESALYNLRRHLFFLVTEHARDHLVVSAGVVGHEGRAIVLPGPTMVGKSQLVAALLRAGALYYTDDWAVFDADGRARPFPVDLLMRGEGKVTPESLGGVRGEEPIPVGLIALLTFRPGGEWRVESRSRGAGTMMLLQAAYGMDEPPAAMKIARNAAAGALVIEGERGEADEAAAALLEMAAQASSGDSS
jgi:hypothetical protein